MLPDDRPSFQPWDERIPTREHEDGDSNEHVDIECAPQDANNRLSTIPSPLANPHPNAWIFAASHISPSPTSSWQSASQSSPQTNTPDILYSFFMQNLHSNAVEPLSMRSPTNVNRISVDTITNDRSSKTQYRHMSQELLTQTLQLLEASEDDTCENVLMSQQESRDENTENVDGKENTENTYLDDSSPSNSTFFHLDTENNLGDDSNQRANADDTEPFKSALSDDAVVVRNTPKMTQGKSFRETESTHDIRHSNVEDPSLQLHQKFQTFDTQESHSISGDNGKTKSIPITRKRIEKRNAAIREVYETERSYLKMLRAMRDEFQTRLKAYCDLKSVPAIIDHQTIRQLFGNLSALIELHSNLFFELKCLSSQKVLHQKLGQVLLAYIPSMNEQYSLFSICYAVSPKIISTLKQQNKAFNKFCLVSERCARHKLESLRIQPIQRLPRYILLIEALQKYTIGTKSKDLWEVSKKLHDVVSSIEVATRIAQAKQRVIDIQTEFFWNTVSPSLVTDSRYCVREGTLCVMSARRGWVSSKKQLRQKPYRFFLFNDLLVWGKSFSPASATELERGRLKNRVPLNLITLQLLDNSSKHKNCFVMKTEDSDPIFIFAESAEIRNMWWHDLNICISKHTGQNYRKASRRSLHEVDELAMSLSRVSCSPRSCTSSSQIETSE